MSTNGLLQTLTKPLRTTTHRPQLRGEQVRAQETFNKQIRGYGNNNAGYHGRIFS